MDYCFSFWRTKAAGWLDGVQCSLIYRQVQQLRPGPKATGLKLECIRTNGWVLLTRYSLLNEPQQMGRYNDTACVCDGYLFRRQKQTSTFGKKIDKVNRGSTETEFFNCSILTEGRHAFYCLQSFLTWKQSQHTDFTYACLPVNEINRQIVCRFTPPHDITLY